jgi:hypothetical protein
MGNRIGKEQFAKLQKIMRSKPNLVSLCGIADDATEADLSDLGMDADDAAVLASELPDKGALTALNLANNSIGGPPTGWKEGKNEGDGRPIYQPPGGGAWQFERPKPEGVIAIANAIRDNGAMTSLNLASNELGAEGAKIVAGAIKVTKCTPAIILARFSCPSDFSINCCCLLLSAGYWGVGEY